MLTTIAGWLFDIYPSSKGITLWFIDGDGTKHCGFYPFHPSFYLHLNDADMKRAEVLAAQCPVPISVARARQTEIYSGASLDVLRVSVHDTTRFKNVVRYYERFFPHFAFFNSDIVPEHLFLYDTQLFPLALGEYELDGSGKLIRWSLKDSREWTEYALPPLSIMKMRNANDFLPPKYQNHLQLELSYDGETYSLEQETPIDVLETLNWHLHRCDPDIILTDHGDSFLLPTLTALARRYKTPLLLNRDPEVGYLTTRESSFFQYGKIVHKDGAFELAGRWHIDVENSFTVVESDLDGLFEIVRITQTCGQHQARASIGTSMSSLQLSWAYRNDILIPAKKREPEEFKSAATLLLADRGGLIFQPPPGYHEDIAELDFVSMYPSIMVKRNVSPETINCRCCRNTKVPELGYTICEKREGIIPATLRMVVDKRAYYKKKKKEWKGKDETLFRRYDQRQNALKWMLVSCFGYLGYKNARFGRIEAHESVNAYSRDTILTAKEIAEAKGFRLVHAIIDCLWLKKEGATDADYEALCREIGARIGIDISLEGIYRWILFPSSKMDPVLPTANRYVGWYYHGEMKIRGIETRRRDTPKFIKRMQETMLERMSRAGTIAELERAVPEVLEIAGNFVATLRSGNAHPMELVIRRNISQEAEEYSNNSVNASVAKAIEEAGVHLSAGERIEYILIDSTGKKQPYKARPLALYAFEDGYDIEKYTELTLKAAETLLSPFGYDADRLKEYFNVLQPRRRAAHRSAQSIPVYESLFSSLS
jgi:DNA polymerase-2